MSKVYCSCGAGFTIRTNRKKGTQFYGCLDYPKCTNTLTVREYQAKAVGEIDSYGFEALEEMGDWHDG